MFDWNSTHLTVQISKLLFQRHIQLSMASKDGPIKCDQNRPLFVIPDGDRELTRSLVRDSSQTAIWLYVVLMVTNTLHEGGPSKKPVNDINLPLYPTNTDVNDSSQTAIWLKFLWSQTPSDFFRNKDIPFDCEFLLAIPKDEERLKYTLKEVYRVGPALPIKTYHFGEWDPLRGLTRPSVGFYERRVADKPSLMLSGGLATTDRPQHRHPYYRPEYRASDLNVNGVKLSNGSWNGIIGLLDRKEAEVSCEGLSMTPGRAEVLDFMVPIKNDRHELSKTRHSSSSPSGLAKVPAPMSARMVCLVSYLTAVILLAGYSASLISNLTLRKPDLPFSTFEGLLASSYKFGITPFSSSFQFFQEGKDPLFHEIYERLLRPYRHSLPSTSLEGLRRVCEIPKYTFLSDVAVEDRQNEFSCHLFPLPEAYLPGSRAMAVAWLIRLNLCSVWDWQAQIVHGIGIRTISVTRINSKRKQHATKENSPGTIWLVFSNENALLEKFVKDINIPFDCEFLVAKIEAEHVILNEVYRVHPNLPLLTHEFGKWSDNKVSWRRPVELYSRRENLQGLVLKTAVKEDFNLQSPSSSILRLVSHWTSTVLIASYSAFFISFLTLRNAVLPFDSFEELLKDGTYRLGILPYSSLQQVFQNANNNILGDVYRQVIVPYNRSLPTSSLEGLQRVCSDVKYAHMYPLEGISKYTDKLKCQIMLAPHSKIETLKSMAIKLLLKTVTELTDVEEPQNIVDIKTVTPYIEL
ncbi:hypothetical protein C0J52_06810 [Blattella germanica]|nr:hypothetical protein C0J52_06810 [Blattella germanica]